MESESPANKEDGGKSLGGQQHKKSCLQANTLFDSSLDHMVRKYPRLFVRPYRWTDQHAAVLHVTCKDEPPLLLSVSEDCNLYQIAEKKQKYLDPRRQHLKCESDESEEIQHDVSSSPDRTAATTPSTPRVYSFMLPGRTVDDLVLNINHLCDGEISLAPRLAAMENLLVWDRSIWEADDYFGWPPPWSPDWLFDGRGNQSSDSENTQYYKLQAQDVLLRVQYGRRRHTLLPGRRRYSPRHRSRIYTLVGGPTPTQNHAWRLAYFDRMQLVNIGPSPITQSRQKSRKSTKLRRKAHLKDLRPKIKATSVKDNEHYHTWPLTRGYMAGLFLAMAQQQHEEPNKKGNEQSGQQVHEKTALTPSHNHTQSNIPELEPRYQILLTDNERDRSCIHLFTAQVSKFLVEHFRTPARLPDIALSEDDPSLIKIHHTIIPFKSWQSFRGRLRMAIMKYANGTADGFFCHQSQQQSQAQEHTNEPTAATVEQRETRHYKQEQEEAYPIDESRETPEPRETRHLQEERGQENMNEILATTMTVEPKEQEYQQQEQEQERTSVSGTAMFSSKEITAQQQEEQNEAEVHVRVEFSVTDIADANIPSEQECYNNVGTLRTKRKRSHMFDEHRQRQAREDEVESFGPRAKKIRTPRDEDSFDQMIW